MMDRSALRKQLLRHEGLKLKPYRDTLGKLTIGCGRNLTDRGITINEAMTLLEHDIDQALSEATGHFAWFADLDEVRQRVIVDMIFNLGVGRFSEFQETIRAIQRHDWQTAALELLKSDWATQVGSRATRLATMMQTGENQA